MAKAQPSVSNRLIENVHIVHSEEDLEPVVRRLACGLEKNLKLPGQADYERGAAPSPDSVINQLKKAYDLNAPTVLYISDDFLKLFKKKKKQVDALKNVLQKDAEAATAGKNIVTLWGELKEKDLVKKVLGVDFSKIQKGHLCDLQLANFSLNEVGNIVEAVLKLWSGPDAALPKPTHDTGTEIEALDRDTCSQDPGLCDAGEEICGSAQSTALHVSVIHFDQKDLPFVSRVAFHLMELMKLQKSVDFFTFYDKDDTQMISKSLAQLNDLKKPNEKAVVIINTHLMNLFKSNNEAFTKFESLCTAVVEQTNNVVFLLKNSSLDEVKECSELLAAVISRKCHEYKEEPEDKNYLETAVFGLIRFLRDGTAIENDESTMVRPMKEEYADHKRNVVGSNGESISAELLGPMSGSLSVTDMLSKDSAGHNEKSKDILEHIVTSSGDSLHMRGMEQSTPVASNHNESGSQVKRTTESLQQHATPNVDDSERTISKLDGFSGYYQEHQIQPSHSETLFNQSVYSSSKTVQEQPNQNGFSPVSGGSIPLASSSQIKPISMENNKDGPCTLRSRATTDSSPQDASTHQLAASKTDDNTDLMKAPHFQQTRPTPVMFHERMSKPTYAPATQYPVGAPNLPEGYNQRNTNATHVPQHPVSQQSVPLTHYGVSPTMPIAGNHPLAQHTGHQPPVTGQVAYGPHAPHNSNPWQHQSHISSALTAQDFTRLMSNPEFRNQFERFCSLQTQPTGVPAQQPASAQTGKLPGRPVLHSSRSTPEMAGSNLAVPRTMATEARLLSLNTEVKHKIGLKLNSTKLTGFYWKHFAEEMGVSQDEIRNWESIPCNYMDKLFEWLGTTNEEYTVREFKELATRFERADILKILFEARY